MKTTVQLLQQSNKKNPVGKYFPENKQLIFIINLRIIFISIYTYGISNSPSLSFNSTSPAVLPALSEQL